MSMRTGVFLAVLGVTAILAGCRLEVIVSDGGMVQSDSGERDCGSASYCVNLIEDPNFGDSFTVVANPGYEFVNWQGGHRFNCPDSTNPTCTIELTGSDLANYVVSTYESTYLMPVFRYLGLDSDEDDVDNRYDDDDDNDLILDVDDLCPLDPEPTCGMGNPMTDTVTVGSLEWAQPDLFESLSPAQIAVQCPGGVCSPGSTLNGWALDGFMWATVDDVNALLNAFADGNYFMGPGPDRLQFSNDTLIVEPFFDSGFRRTDTRFIWGLTSDDFLEDDFGEELHLVYSGGAINNSGQFGGADVVFTNSKEDYDFAPPNYMGTWFYRPITP